MRIKEYSCREIKKIMKQNGFEIAREPKGSHVIFQKGSHTISIPFNSKSVNKMLFLRLIKENDLIVK